MLSFFNVGCSVTIALNIYFTLTAFTFLLIESLIILHKLVDKVIIPVLESTAWVIIIGFVPPLIFTAVTVPFIIDTLTTEQSQM